ncbi:MAG: LysR family transcriptional regulator [Alphaproteobacteria bacterium]|nr:LysR family transcriptional regulator [Alphaproteobacteria bacterium]
MVDLDSLRCFVAAAERLNFRAAARQVALSPAAFSERIKRLEGELGALLFARTTRSVALTPAGVRLLPQARRCLDEAQRCAAVVTEHGPRPPFVLRIGTRYELGMSWIVPSLSALEEREPQRRLHLSFGDSPELLRKLDEGEIDAVVSSVRLTQGGLDYVVLHAEEYAFVGLPALFRDRPLEEPPDAVDHHLLDIAGDLPLFRYLMDALDSSEPWPFGRMEILGTIAAVRFRALEGAGVAVLPLYFVRDDLAAGRLVRLLPELSLRTDSFRLIWRARSPKDPDLRVLAEQLKGLPLQ